MLFASGETGLAVIFILGVIGVVAYHGYIFFARPELWAQMQRQAHEKKMAAAAERSAKAGRVAGGILDGIAKAVLGAALKGRPHH